MAKLISRAQFARKMGLSKARITQLVKGGVISLVNGKIDAEKAEGEILGSIDRRVDSTKGKARLRKKSSPRLTEGNGQTQTLTEARRQTELLKAELLVLRLQVERGDLIPKNEPIEWFISAFMPVKHAIMNFAARMTPHLVQAGLVTPENQKETFILLRSECYSMIRELGKAVPEFRRKGVFLDEENDHRVEVPDPG